MNTSGSECKAFTYPWGHWYANPVAAILLATLLIWLLYQRNDIYPFGIVLALAAIVAGVIVGTIVEQFRRFRQPHRIVTDENGLEGQLILRRSVFIPWASVQAIQKAGPSVWDPIGFGRIKIEATDGTSVVIGTYIRGFDELESEIGRRAPVIE
jgi:membrane protein YdbS with pleckstrin-like domain